MIPKVIHHIAPADKKKWHPVWDKCYPTWLNHFSDCDHILWNDEQDLDNLIGRVFPHYYVDFKHIKHIQKIDIAKMVMIYEKGGLYVDMDYYCRTNFFRDFQNKVVVSGSPHEHETLQNGLIAAEPRHPFILQHINNMFEKVKTVKDRGMNHHDYIQATTGPFSLGDTYHSNKQYWTDIQKLDHKIYNPVVSSFYHKYEMYGVKCIHLLTGWWGKEARTPKKKAGKIYQDWRKVMIGDL